MKSLKNMFRQFIENIYKKLYSENVLYIIRNSLLAKKNFLPISNQMSENIQIKAQKYFKDKRLSIPVSLKHILDIEKYRAYIISYTEVKNKLQEDGEENDNLKEKEVIGFHLPKSKRIYIVKENNERLDRQRFTLMHELSHVILKHDNKFRVTYHSQSYTKEKEKKEEREADNFAANILMPTEVIKNILPSYETLYKGFALDCQLSDHFMVTPAAMSKRMSNYRIKN